MKQKIQKTIFPLILLFSILICIPSISKSQDFNSYLGKSKAEIINILSNNDKLTFSGINQSKDGVQFLHYVYKENANFSEAFFFDNESVCFTIKHIYPVTLYIETVRTLNSRSNLELKSNDFWVDMDQRLTYGIRMVPGTKSFAIEVAKF